MLIKKGGIILGIVFILVLSFGFVSAASCSIIAEASCAADNTVMTFFDTTNTHGNLYGESVGQTHSLCCDFTGTHVCDGTNDVLKLSSASNAHAEINSLSTYSTAYDVCFGDLVCVGTTSPDSATYPINMTSLTSDTNAHLGGFDDYLYKIVCSSVVEGACTADGYCNESAGEDYTNCPDDCLCGDGFCVAPENSTNCADDCYDPEICTLDTYCDVDVGENYTNCADDCPCGDGFCVDPENYTNCALDCPDPEICTLDTYCDVGAGENSTNCADDCFCGDGSCIFPENYTNCELDCPSPSEPYCGDGSCLEPENYTNCALDCPSPPPGPYCGDGDCILPENYTNCIDDCYDPMICIINDYCNESAGENYTNCPDCSIPYLFWSNEDNTISRLTGFTWIEGVNDTAGLVVINTKLLVGTEVILEVMEDDSSLDDSITSLSGIVDSDGNVFIPWTINSTHFEDSIKPLELDYETDDVYEFYFKINVGGEYYESDILYVNYTVDPDAYWTNNLGEPITTLRWEEVDNDQVYLVIDNSGLPEGDVLFNISDKDSGEGILDFTDDDITSIVGTVTEGRALVNWTITELDFEEAGTEAEIAPNVYKYEFYFEVGDIKSGVLEVERAKSVIEDCVSIFICSDYGASDVCVADSCDVSADSAPSSVDCTDPSQECSCAWDEADAVCEFHSVAIDPISGDTLGYCDYAESSEGDCEFDEFLRYFWSGAWAWDAANNESSGSGDGWIQDLEGWWHYDPTSASVTCEEETTNVLLCPAQIQLNFFTAVNILVALVIIFVIYYLMRATNRKKTRRSAYPKLRNAGAKKKVVRKKKPIKKRK